MDTELMMIQMEHDFNELAEQYDGAAENELMFALGAPDAEATKMHTQNVVQNREMAKFYRYLASRALDLIESFEEEN
jgi:uncharacterized membrane protein